MSGRAVCTLIAEMIAGRAERPPAGNPGEATLAECVSEWPGHGRGEELCK